MKSASRRSWSVLSVLALLSACASNRSAFTGELEDHHGTVELERVPFHSQVTDQCGPAALASLLNDAGVAVNPSELKSRVYIPGRQGSLQLELMAATRHFGRIPYQVDHSLSGLIAELEAGRPVLVLQNLGLPFLPKWHYAVVVGYLAGEEQFVLRSGDKARLLMDAGTFFHSWKRGDFWAFVALQPGELPANVDADRYLRSVAAIESIGDFVSAVSAYRAATARWPESELAWLGLGNAFYGNGDLIDAGNAYRQVLEIRPGNAIALNNLSQVYLGLGCRDEALGTIAAALSGVNASNPVHAHLLLTRNEVNKLDSASRCF